MKKICDVTYSVQNDVELKLDLYLPDEGEFDIYIHFHGGGLEKGSRKGGEIFRSYLAEHNIATASVEYRMYPDCSYPDFLIDAANSVKFISEHIKEYGNCRRIFVGGSSAGGYMSMMLCFDRRWYDTVGISPEVVSGYVHDAGQPTAHFKVLKHRGLDPRRVIVDETAPLYHIGVEKEYPPMTFIISDNDMKNRYEQTMLVLSTLKHFEYDESKYSYTLMHGTHTNYTGKVYEDGRSIYGDLIERFIKSVK